MMLTTFLVQPVFEEVEVSHQEFEAKKENIEQDLAEYEAERERVKRFLEQVNGKRESVVNKIINTVLIVGLVALTFVEFIFKLLPAILALEIGVLLVSLKIIWMMYMQERAFHFQFWVLNSLEYRVNEIAKRVRSMERHQSEQAKSAPK